MPRYFFDIDDGRNAFDEHGLDLPDVGSARRMAVRTAGEMVSDATDDLRQGAPWTMVVTDGDRRPLFKVEFRIVSSTSTEDAPSVPLRENAPGRR